MSIWKDKDWNCNSKKLDILLPMLYIGLTEFTPNVNIDVINGDISAKILSYVYFSEIFSSPIKLKIPLSLPDTPVRPKKISRRLF